MPFAPHAIVQAALPGFDDILPIVTVDRSYVPPEVAPALAVALSLGGRASTRERCLVQGWGCWRTRGAVPSDAIIGSLAGCPTWAAGEAADELAREGLWPTFRSVDEEPSEAEVHAAIAAARRAKVDALVRSATKVRRRLGRLALRERRGAVVMVRKGEAAEVGRT
jgi:hypothetical protein